MNGGEEKRCLRKGIAKLKSCQTPAGYSSSCTQAAMMPCGHTHWRTGTAGRSAAFGPRCSCWSAGKCLTWAENGSSPWAEPAATMSRTASWSRTIPSLFKSSNGSTQEGRPSGSTTDPGGKRSCPARRSTRKHEGIWNVQAGRWTTSSRTARPPASRMSCSRRYPGRTNSQISWRRCSSGAGSDITSSDTTTAIW